MLSLWAWKRGGAWCEPGLWLCCAVPPSHVWDSHEHVACEEVIPVVTLSGEESGQEESREMRTVKPAQGTSL